MHRILWDFDYFRLTNHTVGSNNSDVIDLDTVILLRFVCVYTLRWIFSCIALASVDEMHTSLWSTQVLTVSENDTDTDLFRAAQVSIGMLGVLMEVTVRVEPLFYLEENRTSRYSLDECLQNLDSFVESSLYVKMWIEFYNNFCILYQTDKTNTTIATDLKWYLAPLTVRDNFAR